MNSSSRAPGSQAAPACSSSQLSGGPSAETRVNELYVPMLFMKDNFADATFPIHIRLQVQLDSPTPSAPPFHDTFHSAIIRKYEHYGNRTFHYLLTSMQPTLKIPGSSKPKPVEWTKLEDGCVRVRLELPSPQDPSQAGPTSTTTSGNSLGAPATLTGATSLVAHTTPIASKRERERENTLTAVTTLPLLSTTPASLLMAAGALEGGRQLLRGGDSRDLSTSLGLPVSEGVSAFGVAGQLGGPMELGEQHLTVKQARSLDQLLEMMHPMGHASPLAPMTHPASLLAHSPSTHQLAMTPPTSEEGPQPPSSSTDEPALMSLSGGVMNTEQLQQQMVGLVRRYRALHEELVTTRSHLLAAESTLGHVQQELQKCKQELEATRIQHAQQQTLRRQLASTAATSAHSFMNTLTQLLALQ